MEEVKVQTQGMNLDDDIGDNVCGLAQGMNFQEDLRDKFWGPILEMNYGSNSGHELLR